MQERIKQIERVAISESLYSEELRCSLCLYFYLALALALGCMISTVDASSSSRVCDKYSPD